MSLLLPNQKVLKWSALLPMLENFCSYFKESSLPN